MNVYGNDRFDLEIRIAKDGEPSMDASVERAGIARGELAQTVMAAARMAATLLGETIPEPEVACQGTLSNGQSVTVRLGTPAVGEPRVRSGQVVFDLAAPNGKPMIRLVPPLAQYELEALGHAFEWCQQKETEHRAVLLLATLTRVAGLADPQTPHQEAETERALVTMLKAGRDAQRVNGGPADPEGHGYTIERIRQVIQIDLGVSMPTVTRKTTGVLITLGAIAELVGLNVDRDRLGHPVRITRPDDLDITMGPLEDVRHTLKGDLDDSQGADAGKLAELAETLGLKVLRDDRGNPVEIIEPGRVTS